MDAINYFENQKNGSDLSIADISKDQIISQPAYHNHQLQEFEIVYSSIEDRKKQHENTVSMGENKEKHDPDINIAAKILNYDVDLKEMNLLLSSLDERVKQRKKSPLKHENKEKEDTDRNINFQVYDNFCLKTTNKIKSTAEKRLEQIKDFWKTSEGSISGIKPQSANTKIAEKLNQNVEDEQLCNLDIGNNFKSTIIQNKIVDPSILLKKVQDFEASVQENTVHNSEDDEKILKQLKAIGYCLEDQINRHFESIQEFYKVHQHYLQIFDLLLMKLSKVEM